MTRATTVRLATLLTTALAVFLYTGCDGDGPAGPLTPGDLVGTYDTADEFGALSFTTTADGETTDWLDRGASLSLTLSPDGTVAGHLFVPGADEDGSDMDEDMAGTWTVSGNTVLFEQDADTFVRDMPFTYVDGTLSGDRTFSDVRVQVVLVQN